MIYLDKTGLEHYDNRIKEYVGTKIADVVNSAPEALDTLQELADALGNDEHFATTIMTELGKKVDKEVGKGLSTEEFASEYKLKLEGVENGAQVNTVTGVKGEAEIEYRVGQINITKANLGLDSVDNTADVDESVKPAEKLSHARQITISDGVNKGTATNFDGTSDITLMLPTTINANLNGTAAKAISDANGNNIASIYETKANAITGLAVSGQIITYTKGDGKTGTLTTQDTHCTTKLIAGASNSTVNAVTSNGNTCLRLFDDTTARSLIKITGIGSQNTTYNDATQTVHGLMSVEDKKKLDGVASGAQVNSITGVKGNAETSYRTGNINITPANIGLGNVNNTADADKSIKSATKIESTYDGTSGYQELMTWTGSKGTDYAYIRCGMTASDEGYLELSTADNGDSPIYVKQYGVGGVSQTANARVATLLDKSGNTIFPGTVTAASFIGKSTSADKDSNGNIISDTYETKANAIVNLTANEHVITYTKGNGAIGTISTWDTTYTAATQTAMGLMSAADKIKLDGIAAGANAYSLPAATSSELGGVKIGSNITNSNGTISLTKANVTTALGYTPQDTHFTTKLIAGASNSTANAATSNGNICLRLFDDTTARNLIKLTGAGSTTVTSDANGTITINSVGTTYNNAGQTTAGLMSADDKKKPDGISASAQVNSITGVKGNAESSYRTGNVNITPSNIGLGNVNNTADSDKTVKSANTLTTSRTLQTNLASTSAASFNGSANVSIGVRGTLPVSNGGTGQTNLANVTVGKAASADNDGKGNNIAATYATKSELGNVTTPLIDCTTAAGTQIKVVTSTGLSLVRGTRLLIRFTNGNTATSPTLNLNNTGAKSIKYRGYSVAANALVAGGIYDFVYDGTAWEVITPLVWIED